MPFFIPFPELTQDSLQFVGIFLENSIGGWGNQDLQKLRGGGHQHVASNVLRP